MDIRQVVPRDAIPSVEDPTFGRDYRGEPDDRVIVVPADTPRAYPLRYLHYHEIVNDAVGGEPVAVTWCPLCGSAVVYDRRHAGHQLEFGVSGKLADDDLVMYDRETESEWKQSTGECIAGRFAGDSLSVRRGPTTTLRRFRESNPDGVVLQPPGGESEAASDDSSREPIDYDRSPYEEYSGMEGFGLAAHRRGDSRAWERTDDLSPKTVVLGVTVGDTAIGFPISRISDAGGVVRATVGDRELVLVATADDEIHGFVDPGHSFEWSDGELVGDGTTWDPATGRSADGRRLERVPTRRLFAFAWQDDHGPDAFDDRS